VARGVGHDERPHRRGEVAVGDVDRDALLALGPQAVGEQREVGVVVAAVGAGALDGLQLVLEDRLAVVEQPADEGRLAVVDGAGRGEAQEVRPGGVMLEVALLLAVLHGGLAGPVVGAGGAPLGDARGGDLVDDLLGRRAGDSTAPVQEASPTVR
jgi:hypothetical protein